MQQDTICRTIRQYNKDPVSREDMQKLLEIARDYNRVKNCVYLRYGGIRGLPKLYPGYTVQNEMTASGLKEELKLPSVYFYLAVFDALGDIKASWSRLKTKLLGRIAENPGFTPEERHYLRYVLKVSPCLERVLLEKAVRPKTVPSISAQSKLIQSGTRYAELAKSAQAQPAPVQSQSAQAQPAPVQLQSAQAQSKPILSGGAALPESFQKEYDRVSSGLETGRLDSYLRRQVRRHLKKLHTDKTDLFSVSERAYRYADGGIYLSVREKRKRIFIGLTDHNQYKRQIQVRLFPEEQRVELLVPVDTAVKKHKEYRGDTGIVLGFHTMLTTGEGHVYGEKLGEYVSAEAEWIREQTGIYRRNGKDNPGRKKYRENKRKKEAALHTYINEELNRFLGTEKPGAVYLPKLPQNPSSGPSKAFNLALTLWPKGYIRSRLTQKCLEHSVSVVEVTGKDIGRVCSGCGAAGRKEGNLFFCLECGLQLEERTNAARNALKRGREKTTE